MTNLALTLACGPYDRTEALRSGDVKPEGVDLTYLSLGPEETFWRMCEHREFDASEMSLSYYTVLRSHGVQSFIAIPVFPSRFFRHSCIFVRSDSGVERPEQLKGKRVGCPEYAMTAAVWLRGLLQHEYDVKPESMEWYLGGSEQGGRTERMGRHLKPMAWVHPVPAGKTLSSMLESGELDAFLGARSPSAFTRRPDLIRRLFPSCRQVEADYYRRTGIFPIMHTLVIRQELYEAHPWIARSLYKAFAQAKELCLQRMYDSSALKCALPWLMEEVEQLRSLFGADWWPYGLEPNRTTLEAFLQFSYEQGLAARHFQPEELFAPSTLGEFKI
ncbi:MAG: ABC transporter substrate-binding protein [Acidobacteria bacterium]|nr:ABC transporter substrate-binding protein [Acidobacteriota bacterium]